MHAYTIRLLWLSEWVMRSPSLAHFRPHVGRSARNLVFKLVWMCCSAHSVYICIRVWMAVEVYPREPYCKNIWVFYLFGKWKINVTFMKENMVCLTNNVLLVSLRQYTVKWDVPRKSNYARGHTDYLSKGDKSGAAAPRVVALSAQARNKNRRLQGLVRKR